MKPLVAFPRLCVPVTLALLILATVMATAHAQESGCARCPRRQSPCGVCIPRTNIFGLPQGRSYYNGRYFGNFNNRFYGPQYGYF